MKEPYLYPHTLQNNALEAGEYEIEGSTGWKRDVTYIDNII